MSLYEKMRKSNHKALRVGNDYVARSRLIEDFKSGKEPEKKHKTLDYFFEESQIIVMV